MISWYEYDFSIGGMNLSLPQEVYLGPSYVLSVTWSVDGLLVSNIMPGCGIRYADGSIASHDTQCLLLPWEKLEQGGADILINGNVKSRCSVRRETSYEKWQYFKTSINNSDTLNLDLAILTIQFLRGRSIDELNSDIVSLQEQSRELMIDTSKVNQYIALCEKQRMDLYYKSLFNENVYARIPKSAKRQSRLALKAIYEEVVNR